MRRALLRLVLRALGDEFVAENRHVRQIPVPLAEVEAVSDHEAVRDLEARVAHRHVDLAPRRLRQQRADLEARGVAGLEIPNRFVIGYGLDFGERYRNLPYVAVLSDELIPESV